LLVPKIKLFNEFIELYPEQFADMRMWHYRGAEPKGDYVPTSIPPELISEGEFIFLGQRQSLDHLNYDILLDCLDRLLPLYKYTESCGNLQPISAIEVEPFKFVPGFTVKVSSTKASLAARELDINLRHNVLQKALYDRLARQYGADNVRTELPSGAGTSIDVAVCHEREFLFYEIKTAHSPRACLRQALGQLLEYSFWPGSQEAARLIVVGETPLDKEGAKYLRKLRKRFSLPIEYEQVVV
jgi:hypothetical protein